MSRWFRFYDDVIHDAKILKLSDEMFRVWVTFLCLASKGEGRLPPPADIAATLRERPAKVAAWIAGLRAAGLLDEIDGAYLPHNWGGRQYKSDVSTERVKRFRKRRGNVSSDVPETPPETEDRKQISEASASGASAPDDPRTRLFREGLAKLADLTGKGPDACRSFVGKCLQAAGDDAVTVLGLIYEADRNRVAHPAAWISARLKGQQNGSTGQVSAAADNLIERVKRGFGGAPSEGGSGIGAGQADARLLSYGRG